MNIKSFLLLLALTVSFTSIAQRGYVKTKGTAEQKGVRLKDVTVTVRNGATIVSNDRGEFYFTAPSERFSFSNAIKNGYMLTDKDFLSRIFYQSPEWKVIVMERPEKRAQEKKVAVDKIRKKLEADIKIKQIEITRLEKENKNSAAEIIKLKKQLQEMNNENKRILIENKTSKQHEYKNKTKEAEIDSLERENEKSSNEIKILKEQLRKQKYEMEMLIEDMAERYVSIDYDQMDEINRQAADLILNGELEKAKKLLDNQGDLEDSFNDIVKRRKQLEKELTQLEEETNILAERCLNYHNIFLMEHNNDSAAYYLEKRAMLDPANYWWQIEAGYFYKNTIGNYEKALQLYNVALQQAMRDSGHNEFVAICYNNIGAVLEEQKKYNEALDYFKKSLNIFKDLYGEQHPHVATCYNNIGAVLFNNKSYNDALLNYKKSLEIYKTAYGNAHPNLANCYNSIGKVYDNQENSLEALDKYKKAFETYRELFGDNNYSVAQSFKKILAILYSLKKDNEAEKFSFVYKFLKKNFSALKHKNLSAAFTRTNNIENYIENININKFKPVYDGIDVSDYQKYIDWGDVSFDPNIQFAYIKATEGATHKQHLYHKNLENARKNGVKVGSYHFMRTTTTVKAQFNNFISMVKPEEQDLIPVLDIETNLGWTKEQLRDSVMEFAQLIEHYYGCKPMIYTGSSFFNNILGETFADYPLFIARYSQSEPLLNFGAKWILWQYNERGNIDGIDTYVDLNRFNKGCSIKDIAYYNNVGQGDDSELTTQDDHNKIMNSVPIKDNAKMRLVNLDEARQALDFCKELNGTQHPDVASCYYCIGLALSSQGRYDMSSLYFQKAHDLWYEVFEADDPRTQMAKDDLNEINTILNNNVNSINKKNIPHVKDDSKTIFKKAKKYYDGGDLESAEYTIYILLDSDFDQNEWLAKGNLLLCDIFNDKKDDIKEFDCLINLIKNHSGKRDKIFNEIKKRLYKWKDSIPEISAFVDNPKEVPTSYLIARMYYLKDDLENAEAIINEELNDKKTQITNYWKTKYNLLLLQVIYKKAKTLYDNGDLKAAEHIVDRLIYSGTKEYYLVAKGFILLCDIYHDKGNFSKAAENLYSLKKHYPGKENDIFDDINTRLSAWSEEDASFTQKIMVLSRLDMIRSAREAKDWNSLIESADVLIEGQYTLSSNELLEVILAHSDANTNLGNLKEAKYDLGCYYYYKQDYESALKSLDEALENNEEAPFVEKVNALKILIENNLQTVKEIAQKKAADEAAKRKYAIEAAERIAGEAVEKKAAKEAAKKKENF